MPDYFVPLDTTKFTAFHRKLMAKNIIMDTFLKYVDNNRKELKKDYKTFESFKKTIRSSYFYYQPDYCRSKERKDRTKRFRWT